MTFRLLLALALLPLAACGDADDTTVTDSDVDVVAVEPVEPVDEPMMDDAAPTVTADATLEAVGAAGGLTSLAPGAAVENIDAWIATLDGNEAAAPIVANLRTLKDQLTAEALDGDAIGATLVELGTGTKAAAAGDGSLEQLGEALEAAGTQLMSGE